MPTAEKDRSRPMPRPAAATEEEEEEEEDVGEVIAVAALEALELALESLLLVLP